jgi:hypothetical protein
MGKYRYIMPAYFQFSFRLFVIPSPASPTQRIPDKEFAARLGKIKCSGAINREDAIPMYA